ncbi:MAG: UDP-glucose dehydrogenase family protein, partial [Burkholderiaceae bacterium]
NIGRRMTEWKLVVDKSTVPVGTADRVREAIADTLRERGVDIPFAVASNPEFLKEGAAVEDFMRPDRIVVGVDDERAIAELRAVYAPFMRNHERMLLMDVRSAELTKYAANAMLATRISFMNELANLAEKLRVDIEHVRQGIGSDPRIGPQFLYAGAGFGGSCFPKDLRALIHTGDERNQACDILKAAVNVNARQRRLLADKIRQHFNDDVKGRTIALWGLAFKANTDDIREASSIAVIEELTAAGARVVAYDPVAMPNARESLRGNSQVTLAPSAREAVEGADALAVITEWLEFRSPDFGWLASTLRAKSLFDGRNLYDPATVRAAGLTYYGVGRV